MGDKLFTQVWLGLNLLQSNDDKIKGTSNNVPARQLVKGRKISFARSLSLKLLLLTLGFVMIAEALIFFPSLANFRNNWFLRHLETAEAASMVYLDSLEEEQQSSTHSQNLSEEVGKNLLETTQSLMIAVRWDNASQIIVASENIEQMMAHINLDDSMVLDAIGNSISLLFTDPKEQYRVFAKMHSHDAVIELVQEVKPIQIAMWKYARNILFLSLLISLFTAVLVYLALYRLIVRPIIKLSTNMDEFSKHPQDSSLIYKPSNRTDEIGTAEKRLASFQNELQQTLRQKQHLADLGLAVSKINHDLRNILASAQLFSDRLTALEDPAVQRFAPKLIKTIDRAVDYTTVVLKYGQAVEEKPTRQHLSVKSITDDIAEMLGLTASNSIVWSDRISPDLEVYGDPEQLFRVLLNLCRNAIQAMELMDRPADEKILDISGYMADDKLYIEISDTGPGIPDHILQQIFKPFHGSGSAGGSGLGITIASELIRAHGGEIEVTKTDRSGTSFLITLPEEENDV